MTPKCFFLFSLFFLITQIACQTKDPEIKQIILPDGEYSLSHYSGAIGASEYYTVESNKIYTKSGDFTCKSRLAGRLIKMGDSIVIPFLHIDDNTQKENCQFLNDKYGGDTFIIHLENIKPYSRPNNSLYKGISGNWYYYQNYPEILKKSGQFTFVTKVENCQDFLNKFVFLIDA